MAGTYTFEVYGYQGELGDFTFKVQPSGSAAASQAAAVVLTAKTTASLAATITAEFQTQRRRPALQSTSTVC